MYHSMVMMVFSFRRDVKNSKANQSLTGVCKSCYSNGYTYHCGNSVQGYSPGPTAFWKNDISNQIVAIAQITETAECGRRI